MRHNDLILFNVWSTGIAKACEQNLRKTFQFGGRSVYPSNMELKAIMVNKYTWTQDRTYLHTPVTQIHTNNLLFTNLGSIWFDAIWSNDLIF